MKVKTAASNFTYDDLINEHQENIKKVRVNDFAVLSSPFYISHFILDGVEDCFVSFNAVTGKLVEEEDGIKIFITGQNNSETEVRSNEILPPEMDETKIPKIIKKCIKGKKVKHISTELIYYPCLFLEKLNILINTSSATLHKNVGKCIRKFLSETNVDNNAAMKRITTEGQDRKVLLPSKSLACYAGSHFIRWLINDKINRTKKNIVTKEIILSYIPFYIFKYYARRPRALKSYENCSVSGTTGSWNSYAHKILEYDSLKDYSIKPDCNYSFHIDETVLDETEAKGIATDNLRKLPGVVNIIVSDPQIIYFPLWTVHLEDDHMRHKIEVCGVTGYTVFEKSFRKDIIDAPAVSPSNLIDLEIKLNSGELAIR